MDNKSTRQRILDCALEVLMVEKDPEKVTVREIAKRSNVGVGLINYHFKSKDIMLMEAVGQSLAQIAVKWQTMADNPDIDPKQALKTMLSELIETGAGQMFLIRIMSKFELTEGDMTTPAFILPYVKRITGKSDAQARILALAIISGLQTAVLRETYFKAFLNIDLTLEADREKYIEDIIESIS